MAGAGEKVAIAALQDLTAALEAAQIALVGRDRAILAVLFVAERLDTTVKAARRAVADAWGETGLPSESTISRHRARLDALLRRLVPPRAPGHDTAAALRAALAGRSYPAFCEHLRRSYGLLLDPVRLQRALLPAGDSPLPAEVAATVLRCCFPQDAPAQGASAAGDALADTPGQGALADVSAHDTLNKGTSAVNTPAQGISAAYTPAQGISADTPAQDASAADASTRPSPPGEPLSDAAAAQRLAAALAYANRLPGEPGAFAAQLWRITAGEAAEVDRLAERLRAWVVRKSQDDPASRTAWDARAVLALAWQETSRAQAVRDLSRARAVREKRRGAAAGQPEDARRWHDLTAVQRRALATLATLPGHAWAAAELRIIAGAAAPGDLRLDRLSADRWLAPVPAPPRHALSVCPPAARATILAQPDARRLALEGLANLWQDAIIPRFREAFEGRNPPYQRLVPVYEASVGEALVVDCLELIDEATRDASAKKGGRAAAGAKQQWRADAEAEEPGHGAAEAKEQAHGAADATARELARAAELARWMWRALSDILGPSGRADLHLRLCRVADRVLSAPALGPAAAHPPDAAWARAEHALIVAEIGYFEVEAGRRRQGYATLRRVAGDLPALSGGLLPPRAAILAASGAERECLLTAQVSVLQYHVLLASGDLEALLCQPHPPRSGVRQVVQRLALVRALLVERDAAEAADEARRGWSAEQRWNYPSLDRWDRGRTRATLLYWCGMCRLAEGRGAALFDPQAAREAYGEAAHLAAEATTAYRADAEKNARWDRVVHAVLFQGEIACAAGHPVAAAVRAIDAAVWAMDSVLKGETQHLASLCQLESAAALRRLADARPADGPPAPRAREDADDHVPMPAQGDASYHELAQAQGDTGDHMPAPAHGKHEDADYRALAPVFGEASYRTLVLALNAFLAARQNMPAEYSADWAHDLAAIADLRRDTVSRDRIEHYAHSWSTSFLRAVERIAAGRPRQEREQALAAIKQIAPRWESDDEPPARRHHKHAARR